MAYTTTKKEETLKDKLAKGRGGMVYDDKNLGYAVRQGADGKYYIGERPSNFSTFREMTDAEIKEIFGDKPSPDNGGGGGGGNGGGEAGGLDFGYGGMQGVPSLWDALSNSPYFQQWTKIASEYSPYRIDDAKLEEWVNAETKGTVGELKKQRQVALQQAKNQLAQTGMLDSAAGQYKLSQIAGDYDRAIEDVRSQARGKYRGVAVQSEYEYPFKKFDMYTNIVGTEGSSRQFDIGNTFNDKWNTLNQRFSNYWKQQELTQQQKEFDEMMKYRYKALDEEIQAKEDAQESGFWSNLLGGIGTIGGLLLAPATGGASIPIGLGLGSGLAKSTASMLSNPTSSYNNFGGYNSLGTYQSPFASYKMDDWSYSPWSSSSWTKVS